MSLRRLIALWGSVCLFLMLVALPFLVACAEPASTPAEKPIVLGVPLSTGFSDGRDAEWGMRLAVEEINARGGVDVGGVRYPFKIEVMDTRDLEPGVPVSEALLVVEKLILEKKVDFIVGGPIRSEAALAVMDLLSKHKKVSILSAGVLTPAYHKRVAEEYEKYKYAFRTTGSIVPLIEEIVETLELIRAEHGFDRIFIMVQDVAHARAAGGAVKTGLEEKGWNILGSEIYPTGSMDFSIGLLKAKAAKAQFLFIWFDMPESAILLKQWYDMELSALPIGYIHAAKDPGFWEATKGKSAYAVVAYAKAGSVPSAAIPWSEEFGRAFERRWGTEPVSEWSATSYMVPYLLADAIERAGTINSEAVITALEETDMMGVYGRIRFDPKSHQIIYSTDPGEGAVSLWAQWLAGKRVAIFPPKIATRNLELPPWME